MGNTPLNREIPDILDPHPLGPIAGDTHDDDAAVLDETLEAAPSGPVDYSGLVAEQATIRPTTRILSREFVIPAQSGAHAPVMVLPEDPHRLKLVVFLEPDTRIASSLGEAFFAAPAGGTAAIDLEGHTGALWAYSTDTGTDLTVRVWAVTK